MQRLAIEQILEIRGHVGDSRMRLGQPNADEMCIAVTRRQALGATATDWNSDRRERFLLRRDVQRPLSVDERVWSASTDGGCRVAVSAFLATETRVVRSTWFAWEVEEDVRLLGYDVADRVFTSGLSNCGYTDAEKAALRPVWADRLNTFHLFAEPHVACQFKVTADARVPEHAPFLVFGIYLLLDDTPREAPR